MIATGTDVTPIEIARGTNINNLKRQESNLRRYLYLPSISSAELSR